MGNRNGGASSSDVNSYNSSPSRIQRPSSASSLHNTSSSRYRSTDRGRSSSSLSNDSYPLSTLNRLHNSDDASPLINKLRAKVASRMGLGFTTNNTNTTTIKGVHHPSTHSQLTSSSQSLVPTSGGGYGYSNVTNGSGGGGVSGHHHGGHHGPSSVGGDHQMTINGDPLFPKLKSQSSLTNDQLTAHLTEEERLILQAVFEKEEEFHREALSKRQIKATPSDNNKKEGQISESSPTSASPSTAGSQLIGNCRTCRKKILTNEMCNYCDTCSEPICEDCSSYSDKSKEKGTDDNADSSKRVRREFEYKNGNEIKQIESRSL